MKTMNLIRRGLMLLALVTINAILFTSEAQAQQRQDALYIFRNDGQFNAFFYGDIQRICYSNIDTLGVAHDDFVVQEVWALDTVYRIPVSAIDSVSFVTPETKVKADVFCPDKSIANYIIGGDSVNYILLASNTPQELIPSEGQKVLIEEPSKYIPDGFVGRVIYSKLDSDGWLVVTEGLALYDIYDRLMVKAAIGSGEYANARRNGMIDGTELSYVMEEPWPMNNKSAEFSLNRSTDLIPDYVSADLTGSASVSIDPTINSIRAFLFMDPQYGIKADVKTDFNVEGEIKVAVTGSLNGRLNVGIPKDPYKKKVSGLNFEFGVGLFVEASFAGFELSWTKPFKSHVNTYTVVDETDLAAIAQPASGLTAKPLFRAHAETTSEAGKFKFEFPRQVTMGMGIYAKAEAKFGLPFEKFKIMPDFILKKLKNHLNEKGDSVCGFNLFFGIDLGGKVEVKAPVSLVGPTVDIRNWTGVQLLYNDVLTTQPLYKNLDENTEIKFSGYSKAGAELKLGHWKLGFTPINETASSTSYGIVPRITDIRVGYDEDDKPLKPWRLKFMSPISRDLLEITHVGFLVTDVEGKEIAKYCEHAWLNEDGEKPTYSRVFDNIDPGKGEPVTYNAYPLVNFRGIEMLADCKKEFTIDAARFDIENRKIQLFDGDDPERELHLEVIPNMKNVEITPKPKWVKGFFFRDWENDLEIRYEALPDSLEERKGTILLKGLSSKTGEVLVEDSIVITQIRSIMELSSDTMLFDLKGGVGSIQILRTNLKDIEVIVDAGDKWLSGEIHDNYIVMTVDESNEEYRAAIVRVRGYTPGGRSIMRAFWVRQYSTEIVPTVDPDLLVFPLEGGEQTAVFNKADYTYSGVYVSEEGKKWARAKLDDKGVVTVTVDPTKDGQGRGCSVVCWADNTPTPGEDAVLVPITVKQVKPEIKKIYFKTFNKVHSEIVRYNEDDPDNFWNWLLMDAIAESHEMDLLVTKDNFTINSSVNGNTMHVECVGSGQSFGMTQKASLSFDVINYNADKPNKAMVTNVKMSNDVTLNAFGSSGSMNMAVNVDNIPVWNLSPLYIASVGTVANGVKFSNFYDVISIPDGKATGYYEEDDGNNALLRISFEGNDDDEWSDVIEEEDWDDDNDWGDDDDDDWSRSTAKKAIRPKVSSTLERRMLEQLKKIGKQ